MDNISRGHCFTNQYIQLKQIFTGIYVFITYLSF